jgi:hypothetical protein
MRTIPQIHFIEWVAEWLLYSVKIYTYVIPGKSDLLRYLNYKNHFISIFYLYDLVWRTWRLWAFFFNSLTNCITQSGIEYNPTPNISGDSHRSERLPYHTIVTKAVMTCQNEEILKCYYILIFLGVQLILINRNTQSYWVHPNISGVET